MNDTLDFFNPCIFPDEMNERERFLAGAALSWFEGDYMKAGALLESSLLRFPRDILTLRLAQDCYLEAGSSSNALGCAIRHQYVLDSSYHLHGHALGILSAGLTENGQLLRAIETAEKALTQFRGKNCWVLHSLLNAAQLDSRSSLMKSYLSTYDYSTENALGSSVGSGGRSLILFNSGSAMIMRGSYQSAYQVYSVIMEGLYDENQKVARRNITRGQLEGATLLLWQLCLQDGEKESHSELNNELVVLVDLLPFWLDLLGKRGQPILCQPPWLILCASVYVAMARLGLENRNSRISSNKSSDIMSNKSPLEGEGTTNLRPLRLTALHMQELQFQNNEINKRESARRQSISIPNSAERWMQMFSFHSSDEPVPSSVVGEPIPILNPESLLSFSDELIALEERLVELRQNRLLSEPLSLPHLRSIVPLFATHRISSIVSKYKKSAATSPSSTQSLAANNSVWLVSDAMTAFLHGNFERAADLLEDCIRDDGVSLLGGTAVQRDIIRVTYIEA